MDWVRATVGNDRGIDLFISYGAGNGNDIALFSAVPEPEVKFARLPDARTGDATATTPGVVESVNG